MKRRGFTLIELLVVIAIIAILAAILFPVFLQARAKADQTKCMSNMVQLGKAMMAYADDYQGTLPFAWYQPNWSEWRIATWRERIQPYAKSRGILQCPVKTASPRADFSAADVKRIGHYGINVYMTMDDLYNYVGFTKLATVTVPTKTILVTENKDGDWSGEPYDNNNTGDAGQFYPYHGSKDTLGGVFVFCDGHSGFMSVRRTQETVGGVVYYYWKKIKK